MTKPIVSVVIPVYNGEKIVAKAIDSIRNQTLKNIEIIVVDDGSTDGTAAILDEYANKFKDQGSKIKVVHQANQGCYNARTNGFKEATGKYITSVDADDSIEPTMLEEMVGLAEKEGLDLVECDLSIDADKSGRTEIYKTQEETRKNFIEPVIIGGIGFACVCGKLYRHSVVLSDEKKANLVKHRIMLFEDMLLNFQVLDAIKSYGRIHKPLYNYYINEASSVRNFNAQNIKGFEFVLKVRAQYANNYGLKDDDCRLARWALINARNMCMLAAYARQDSISSNTKCVKQILGLDIIKKSRKALKLRLLPKGIALFFIIADIIPTMLLVSLIKIAKRSI